MIIRKLDGSHDWMFGKGLANYAFNEDAISENIQTRIFSWLGDCFFAPDDGVDWKSRLEIGQQVNLTNEIKVLIQQSEGVVGVNSVVLTFNGRTRLGTIVYNIDTIYSSGFQATLTQAIGG